MATIAVRRNVTRLKSLPWPIWRAAILPILFSILTVTTFRLMLPSVLPVDAPKIPIDLSKYHFVTVVSLLLSVALTAGVAEEVAFRGYLQKPLEDSYGIVPALILTGIAFWLAHAEKVSLSHFPFHLLASILLGLSAYFTKSLLPAVIGHSLGDAFLLPAYAFHKPDFIWSSLTATPLWQGQVDATLGERIGILFSALNPFAFDQTGSAQTFAIITWVFLFSVPLTSVAFVKLARVAQRSSGTES